LEFRFVVILAVAMWFITDARAQTPAPAADPSKMLKMYLDAETTGLPGRVEVTVGALNERLRLAPCTQMVPFVPTGARLWGRSLIGVRCQDTTAGSPGWSVLVPVEVKVFGQALVATRALPAGEAPAADALELQEIELTRLAPGVISDVATIGDGIMARTLAAGQPLRREHLRSRPIITVGEMVKLVASGSGFSVTSYGKALNAGADGQTVRVQADSGRTMTGIARAGKVVEIRL
jgi:flagellar basal body P-ring formation protein FlgA